jgi:2'-5' RNA ligase
MAATTGPDALRVFYALRPDARARSAMSRLAQEVAHHGHGRAPRESNLHVTVAFLGEVRAGQVGTLSAIGERVAGEVAPFALALDRIGGTSYGIAWLTVEVAPPPLRALHASLRDALRSGGFATEQRMFRPHVTLARGCARAVHRGRIEPIVWQVERLSLEASTPARGGSEYRTLASWPLALDTAASAGEA